MDSIAGTGAGESAIKAQSDFTKPAYEYLMGSCFAGIWDRNGLEKKYRSLTVISYVPSCIHELSRGRGLTE
jgi:alkylhydroperoxidase/carboxymuconolactone decarboxylase family protein YurZ